MKNHSKTLHLLSLAFVFALTGCGNTTNSASSNGSQSSSAVTASSTAEPSSSEKATPSSSVHVHSYTEVVTEPTCTTKGYTTYTCECGYSYTGNETPAKGHTLAKTDAVVPTCTTAGHSEYYTCSACEKNFSDANGTTEVTDLSTLNIPALGHTLTHVNAVAPTATTPGNIEYYHCTYCEHYFKDENASEEISKDSVNIKRGKLITLEDKTEDITGTLTQNENSIVNDGTSQGTSFAFGDQNNNTEIVLEFDLKIDEWAKNEWSLFTIQYRRWDGNTTYELEVSRDKIVSKKAYWNTETSGKATTDLATITDFKVEAGKSYHVKVICDGWTKTILFGDKRVASIEEDAYNVGRFAIVTWEYTKYTITDMYYRDYQGDNTKLRAEFPEVFD